MSHESPPQPPPDPSHGHEMSDVAVRPILYFIIALVVFGGALQVIMSSIMTGYVAQDTSAAVPSADILRDTGNLDRPAPLQRDTTGDMIKMYAEEDAVLTTYAVDPKTKALRIPLDRAMELVAKKGLPHRDTPAEATPGMEMPIPTRGRAYQTTN